MKHEGCREMLDSLSDYLDGEASARLCREIEQHMAGCKRCRVVIDTLRMTVRLYRRLPHPEMPDDAQERLFRTLHVAGFLRPGLRRKGPGNTGKDESKD